MDFVNSKLVLAIAVLVFGIIGLAFAAQTNIYSLGITGTPAAPSLLLTASAPPTPDDSAPGIANPAAVYCQKLGYGYEITNTRAGQVGICIMPNGQRCDEWQFYAGKCGRNYGYCATKGYNTITKSDGKNSYSSTYAVCVSKRGNKVIGSASTLMGLSDMLRSSCVKTFEPGVASG